MVFNKINDAYESVKNGLEAQIVLATADDKEKLADAKLALSELKDLIADLKDENRTLRERVQLKDAVKPEPGYGWLLKVDDEDPSRRYCQICYYDNDKTIPLDKQVPMHADWHAGQRYCPKCKHYRS